MLITQDTPWGLPTQQQICDLFCRVQPETRAVDLHGLSLTATTQGFLQRNEALGKYMALALQQVCMYAGG